MRTATAIALTAIGAILAFAISAEPPGFSFRITGWVLIVTGVLGWFVPRRGYSWLRRRLVVSGKGQPAIEQRQRRYSRMLVPGGLMAQQPVERETIEQVIEEE